MNGAFIYLIGFAGCGKLTIAKAIQKRMDCILVDNHLVNNVIFSLIDPDGKSKLPDKVWENVHQVRSAVFDTIRNLAKPGRTFIFTNELLEGEERHAKVFAETAGLARARNALFVPVRLTILSLSPPSREKPPRRNGHPLRRSMPNPDFSPRDAGRSVADTIDQPTQGEEACKAITGRRRS